MMSRPASNTTTHTTTRTTYLLLFILILSAGSLIAAIVLQHQWQLAPCPLCIIQRYALWLCGLAALRQLLAPEVNPRLVHGVMALGAVGGLATALRQQWVIAHPTISCGMDPLETALNKLLFAQWWPTMFKADGLCSAELPLLLGISIPLWALLTFIALTIVCIVNLLTYSSLRSHSSTRTTA